MNKTQIAKVLRECTYIIIDSREKDLHIKMTLDQFKVHNESDKVPYGDYTIEIRKNEELGINKTIRLPVSVERKAHLEEISGNLTNGKKRFYAEMQRCVDDNGTMIIAIEKGTYKDIVEHNYKTQLTPKSFLAQLHTIYARYGVPFIFVERDVMSLFIYNHLKYHLKEFLKKY